MRSNEPLVLLHGALGTAAQLAPLSDTVVRLGFQGTVHPIDFEGHGAGAPRDRPFRIAHFVENVRDLLDRIGAPTVSIFGYSMGGYVAASLALQTPGRVGRIMTLGTKWRWSAEVVARETKLVDPAGIERKVPKFAAELAARHPHGWERVADGTREMMEAFVSVPKLDDDAFRSLAVPVRVAVGDRDATVSVDESAEVSRLLPAGQLEVLPDTAHPFERVSMDRLARSLIAFLQPGS